MSKNKDKHHSSEDTAKHQAASANHKPEGEPTPAKVEDPAPAEPDAQARKIAQLEERLLRLQADFDNFRKRTLREKNELFDSANQTLMLELLPVLDHLHLAIQAASEHQADKAFREGLILILDQLMGALSKFGLSVIDTDKQIFDPNRFEAVNSLPSATAPEGTVLNQIRRGYMLRNKLLRAAQVIISGGPSAPAPDSPPAAPMAPPDQDSTLADET